MTLVGKILVIVIMVFALLFLGFSTVVFTTATNWKDETSKQKDAASKLQTTASTLKAQVEAVQKDFEAGKAEHATNVTQLKNEIGIRDKSIADQQAQITQAQSTLEGAQQTARVAVDETAQRTKEVDLLRNQNEAVRKQADEFKLSRTELEDQRRELQRQLETAQRNNADLLDRVSTLSSFLRSKNLSDNVAQIKSQGSGVAPPPDVEGRVDRVVNNNRVELSIGSDDGLAVGQELSMYRTEPKADYIGKIRIVLVEPDKAVGVVVGRTAQGKKIEEGDIVASTIRTRR